MAHQQISNWLEAYEPDFNQGKYLLRTFGREYKMPFPESVLDAKSSYSLKKLRQALAAVNKSYQAPKAAFHEPAKDLPKHIRGKTAGYPSHLVAIDRKLGVEFSEMNTLANKKHDLEEGEELRKLALEVVQAWKDHRWNWKQLDHFAQFGQVMPGTEPQKSDSNDLVGRLCEWLDEYPALLDYSMRYKKSKDPKKRAEAERRRKKIDEIKSFVKSRKDADR